MDAATPERWLPPRADTLVALAEAAARPDTFAWSDGLRRDPGLVWLFFTHHTDLSLDRTRAVLRQGLEPHPFLDVVLHEQHSRLADWAKPSAHKVFKLSQCVGALAEHLASQVRLDPLLAHCLGQMTQLGPLVLSQSSDKSNGKDPNIHTRQLIRRVTGPAWLRELLLVWDLPIESKAEVKELHPWVLILQAAVGLASKDAALQTLGMAAAQWLKLSWEQESEYALQLLTHLPDPPAPLTEDASKLLFQSLRLVHGRPAQTLSFNVNQLEAEVEDLRIRLSRAQHVDGLLLREQKLTAVAELAAGAGHEINNPLAVISGQAQYLLKQEEDLNRAKALERIIAQTTRIHALLRDLMFYARPPEPRYKSTSIAKLVKIAVSDVADLAFQRSVKLDIVPAAKVSLTSDPELITTALACLVQNAVEAAPTGGWVRLTTSVHHGRVAFHVEDSGPGVPLGLQENVFDPFFSGRTAGRGVGLGLSKVWRIAQLHGGDVRLDPRPGQPTRFTLELPLKPTRSRPLRLKRPA
jgi:signal transduction histidine kinase